MLKTPEFRVSFPNIFAPSAFTGQEAKYGITMLFPKTTDLSAMKKLAKDAVEKKWPDPKIRAKVMANPNFRNPFRDGDTEKPDVAGYEGMIFVRANSKQKVGLVDRNALPITDENGFYAGCFARATVTAYGYDRAGNIGVTFGLQGVQKLRDGEAFNGRKPIEEQFEALDGDDGAPAVSAPTAAAPAAVKPATDMFA